MVFFLAFFLIVILLKILNAFSEEGSLFRIFSKVIGWLILGSVICFLIFRIEYRFWVNSVLVNYQNPFIELVAVRRESEPLKIYSWIWKIPNRILLINRGTSNRINDRYFLIKYFDYQKEGDFNGDVELQMVYDYQTRKYAILYLESEIEDLSKLNFNEFDSWINENVYNYLTKQNSKYY